MAKMYRVYSIIERHKQDDYWLNIGVAFPHDDGKGFNVMLQALPLHGNGKLVLREHEPQQAEEEPAGTPKRSAQQSDRDGGSKQPERRSTSR